MEFTDGIQEYVGQPITKQVILELLKDYKRPYDKINDLVKQGFLNLVKRGVYVPGPKLKIAGPEPFLLANHLYGPSYVSMETALSYWGLIPEKVFEISSATTQNTKIFKSDAARFSYTHLPLPYYSFGIKQLPLTQRQVVMIATPEKALCDKIVTGSGILLRSKKQVSELLSEDLRIETDGLRNLDKNEISKWIEDAPKKTSLKMLHKLLTEL